MKLILMLFPGMIFFTIVTGQNIKRIVNLKDGWGLSFDYTGEVKNGKPNGKGVAHYSSGNVTRYVGNFVNGVYEGKGTMIFKSGAMLTGNWKNWKMNGKGTNLLESGGLYIGEFAEGLKSGQGVLFSSSNDIAKGNFKNDKKDGRCITIWDEGSIVSDLNYIQDKRTGTGYQYEIKTKKLYQGEWQDDKWVQPTTVNFKSFLTAADFTSQATEKFLLAGPVNSNNTLKDTAYYYDLAKKTKYFGYYVNGKLRNGIIRRDDSTVFWGPLDEKGAQGYGYSFKNNSYYSEGNYVDDYLNGNVVNIDLKKKTVYYGDVVMGSFTGKATLFNENGTMYSGDYVNGRFNGNGFRLEKDGKYVSGKWDDGKLIKFTTIINKNGDAINGSPTTFSEAINSVIKDYLVLFDDLSGEYADSDDIPENIDEDEMDVLYSMISVPASVGKNLIVTDFDMENYCQVNLLLTDNPAKAKSKYSETANQLLALTLTNSSLMGKVKLTGKTKTPLSSNKITYSEYKIATDNSDFEIFRVWLVMEKTEDGDYSIYLMLGESSRFDEM